MSAAAKCQNEFSIDRIVNEAKARLFVFIFLMACQHKAEMARRTSPLVLDFGDTGRLNIRFRRKHEIEWFLTFTDLQISTPELRLNLPIGVYEIEIRVAFHYWKKMEIDTRKTGHVKVNLVRHFMENEDRGFE